MSSALRHCLLQAPAQNLFLATHAFSSIDTADAAGRAYRHRGGAGTGPEFAVHGGASTTHRDMSRSMGGARAPLYAAWCPGPDLSGSSVRCLLGVEIMWRSRRDDACTTPSCEVTDAIAFADFGAPGAGPRLGIPRVSGKSVVPRRDDRTAPLPTSYYVHAICHDRPEPRYYQGAVAVYSTGGPSKLASETAGACSCACGGFPRCHGRCGAALAAARAEGPSRAVLGGACPRGVSWLVLPPAGECGTPTLTVTLLPARRLATRIRLRV